MALPMAANSSIIMSIMLPWATSTPAGKVSWVSTAWSTLAVSWLTLLPMWGVPVTVTK